MIVNANKLFPAGTSNLHYNRILLNPFVRLVLYILIITAILGLINYLFQISFDNLTGLSATVAENGLQVVQFVLLFFIYKIVVKRIEKRPVYELSNPFVWPEIFAGIFMGSLLIIIVVAILAIPGYFSIVQFNKVSVLVSGFFTFGFGAFFEELLFRLIIFKLMEEYFGSWISLTINALLFGAAHLFNQNATLWSAFAIATEAGILLSIAFIFTRRIWLAFGIHFGWNFTQASVFGIPTSGISFDGLITPSFSGPVWLTGGDFGLEASPISIILGLLLSYFLLKKALMDDQTILPAWNKKKKPEIRY